MSRQRIYSAWIGPILALTLACGVTATPVKTPVSPSITPAPPVTHTPPPATRTLESAPTPEASLVQIGYFNSVYLRYDLDAWHAISEAPSPVLNQNGEPIEALQHATIPGCILHDNLGKGAPLSWERQDTNRTIGGLEYRVESWTETSVQKKVLVVYQYPADQPGNGTRIELVIDLEPESCIQSAEEVLAFSADLIPRPP
ncbi:MAG TPA: hypothetical protein VFY25_07460 [Anaerolineales bacterium]|nr:hypothetical protein [Anaerolineales bacterium]